MASPTHDPAQIRGELTQLLNAQIAMAGEQAGFPVEYMIWLLNAGVTIEGLLQLIEWRLGTPVSESQTPSTQWVV